MKPIISVQNLSKRYKLGVFNAKTLREEAEAFLARFGRKKAELAVGSGQSSVNSSLVTSHSSPSSAPADEFWALKDVSFDVQPGEVIGVIGRNGAGKSTLLKILSRITEPTSGEARIRGRVASLLEVGTGFHPELTGRENVFLNGAILGMSKAEIRSKFDEIVAFAEIEKFIDTPVKRYSSGMYVRLAFAVAAHLEPEILIVDEVLAVGDVEFQRKCLGKMKEVSGQDGRTVLFVSHNLNAVQNLCGKALYLKEGREVAFGPCFDVLKMYQTSTQHGPTGKVPVATPEMIERAYVTGLRLEDDGGVEKPYFKLGEPWTLKVRFKVVRRQNAFVAAVGVRSLSGTSVQTAWTNPEDLEPGHYEVVFRQQDISMSAGGYILIVGLSASDRLIQQFEAVQLDILADNFRGDFVPLPAGAGLIVNSMHRSVRAF
jgi:lipopolysaccharide transport system ATP-binding protein